MTSHIRGLLTALALTAFCVFLGGTTKPAAAESLGEALAAAYEGNPTLRAERARQRATDEQVPQALSGWRPIVNIEAQLAYDINDVDNAQANFFNASPNEPVETYPAGVRINLAQPIFRGFRTVEATARAEATVRAGRQNLLAVEQQVLFNTVQAYMNVLRDRQIVRLLERNVAALQEQLDAAQTRFNVGEVTRTDVAQARSRLAEAQSGLSTARFNLVTSTANYTNVVGHPPGKLAYPKIAKLPKTLELAVEIADRLNPNILSAAFIEDAAIHEIEVQRGSLLPEISLEASASENTDDLRGEPLVDVQNLTVAGVVTVPLYQAGSVYSAVRQSKQVASQRRIQVVEAGRNVREAVVSSWDAVQTTYRNIALRKVQVSAAQLALEGVRQEYLVGSRTTLDVLNAEEELNNARIALAQEERDLIVAAYQVLGSIGKLTAQNLRLNVDYYDVEENYLKVRNKWFGTHADTVD
jgi:TolC family type I secretion outer membrane protein